MIKTMSKNEFDELAIKKSKGIDFVAKCSTPWHLIGFRAFLERLITTNSKVKGILLIKCFSGNGKISYFVNESYLVFPKQADVEVFYEIPSVSRFPAKIKKLKSFVLSKINKKRDEHVVYVLQSFYQDYKLAFSFQCKTKINNSLVCIDEGVGSYRNRRDLTHYYFSKGLKKGLQAWLDWSLSFLLNKRIQCPQEWFTILKKSEQGWVKNEEVCELYNKVLRQSEDFVIGDEKYILVLTQPFDTEEDRMSASAMYAAIDNEISTYQEKGYKIYIKPHPRETDDTINSYKQKGYSVFPFAGGFETIMGGINNLPECVIGLNTTSLITAKVLFDIRAVSVIKKARASFSKGTQKTYKAFYGYFRNIVEF